ncbi:MAG: phnA protein [Myxococcota bacterium]
MGRREQHAAKVAAFQALGKDLARRARSRCELCDQARSLSVLPVPPPDEADLESAILVCEPCREWASGGRIADPAELRFLETSAWSEIAPVQVVSVRLLRRLAEEGTAPWAADVLEGLWLPDEVEERVSAQP